jgi:hypothetical protein
MQSFVFCSAKKILKKVGGAAWIEARRRIIAARSSPTQGIHEP